jgi:hypothetical protein
VATFLSAADCSGKNAFESANTSAPTADSPPNPDGEQLATDQSISASSANKARPQAVNNGGVEGSSMDWRLVTSFRAAPCSSEVALPADVTEECDQSEQRLCQACRWLDEMIAEAPREVPASAATVRDRRAAQQVVADRLGQSLSATKSRIQRGEPCCAACSTVAARFTLIAVET